MRVEFIEDCYIKKRADALRKDYCAENKTNIEGIATKLLGLSISFFDLKACYGSNTLGMIIPEKRRILCDQSLEPYGENKETNERVLRFTIAHEVGHYIFHKEYMGSAESPLFHENLNSKEKKRIETQADRFAAEILMPQYSFIDAFYHTKKNCGVKTEYEIKSNLSQIFNVSKESVSWRIKALNLKV